MGLTRSKGKGASSPIKSTTRLILYLLSHDGVFSSFFIPQNEKNKQQNSAFQLLIVSDLEGKTDFLFQANSNFKNIQMGSCVSKGKDDDDSIHNVEFSGGNVHLITTKESWDDKLAEAGRDGKIVVANFSATWCGPCKIVAPFYIELSEKNPSLMFLLVDVDELSDFSSSWDIKATPTFFFLKNGQQIGKLVGANKPELQKKITSIVDSVPASPQRL